MNGTENSKCGVCGTPQERSLVRPMGGGAWICSACDTATAALQRPRTETLHGRAVLSALTIARAERLAIAGAGWSADQVMRRALDLLELQAGDRS